MPIHRSPIRSGLTAAIAAGAMAVAGLGGCATPDLLREAQRAQAAGDATTASQLYQRALDRKPKLANDADFSQRLRTAQRDEALQRGERQMRAGGDGGYARAVEAYEAASRIDPDHAPTRAALEEAREQAADAAVARALAAADGGRSEAVGEALARALGYQPDHAEASAAAASLERGSNVLVAEQRELYKAGLTAAGERRWREAEAAFDAVVEAEPHHIPARLQRAQARAILQQAAGQYVAARDAAEAGRLDEALDALSGVLDVQPAHPEARPLLESVQAERAEVERHLKAARALLAGGQHDEGLREARAAAKLYPTYSPAQDTLGRARAAASADRVAAGDAALEMGDVGGAEAKYLDARSILAEAPGVQDGLRGVASARAEAADRAGLTGHALLWRQEAAALGARDQTDQPLSQLRNEAGVTLTLAPATSTGGAGDAAAALESRVREHLAQRTRGTQVVSMGEGGYAAEIVVRSFDVDTSLASSSRQVQPFNVESAAPNPAIRRLRSAVESCRRQVHDLEHDVREAEDRLRGGQRFRSNVKPDHSEYEERQREVESRRRDVERARDRLRDGQQELRSLEYKLSCEPATVVVVTREEWPYVRERHVKRGVLRATLTLRDAQGQELATRDTSTTVTDEDYATRNPNPEIGVSEDRVDLISDREVTDRLLSQAADDAAVKLLTAAVERRAAAWEAAADAAQTAGDSAGAVEARVRAAVVLQAVHPEAAAKQLEALRRARPSPPTAAAP